MAFSYSFSIAVNEATSIITIKETFCLVENLDFCLNYCGGSIAKSFFQIRGFHLTVRLQNTVQESIKTNMEHIFI